MRTILKIGCLVGLALPVHAASPVPTLQPPAKSHRLMLKSFAMPAVPGPIGLLIIARVNGGPPLRLLLDSGAQFLVLDKKMASRSNLNPGEPLDLVTAGGSAPRSASKTMADVVEVGGLELHRVEVAIVEGRVLDGVDGVFPLGPFSDYLIRLDVPAKNLELTPYPLQRGTGTQARVERGLLFLRGVLNEAHEGYFLLDTGASYNAISSSLARRMKSTSALSRIVQLQGGANRLTAPFVSEVLRFRVGQQELKTDPFVAVDLSMASKYYNFEVSGLVGYPALRNSVVTVNYREHLVLIERK